MNYIPISIFFAGLIVWNTVDRIIYSRKRREWVEVKAIVRSVVSKPVGEFPEGLQLPPKRELPEARIGTRFFEVEIVVHLNAWRTFAAVTDCEN